MTTDVGTTPRKALTPTQVRELFHYDPATGRLVWLQTKYKGLVAGSIDTNGHRRIQIDGRTYGAHIIAWAHYHGRWPVGLVDHRNGSRDENWIDNLREATRAQNNANAKRRRDNTVGLKGVSRHKKRFRAQIQVQGKKLLIGVFGTAEAAHAAYCKKAAELFREFARFE